MRSPDVLERERVWVHVNQEWVAGVVVERRRDILGTDDRSQTVAVVRLEGGTVRTFEVPKNKPLRKNPPDLGNNESDPTKCAKL